MILKLNKRILLIAFALVFASGSTAFSQGKNLPKVTSGQYFTIYGYSGLDTGVLLGRLNFNSMRVEDLFKTNRGDMKSMLGATLDDIFLEASDILDIHIYSFLS